jgi:hypothetical protein
MYIWDDDPVSRSQGPGPINSIVRGPIHEASNGSKMTTSTSPRRLEMEPLFIWIVIVAALVALDASALLWGADSRDRLPDDHHR